MSPFRSENLALTEQLRRVEERNAAAAAEVRELAGELSLRRKDVHGAIRVAVWVFLVAVAMGVGSLLGSLAGGLSWSKHDVVVRAPSTVRREVEVERCWRSVRDLGRAHEYCLGARTPRIDLGAGGL